MPEWLVGPEDGDLDLSYNSRSAPSPFLLFEDDMCMTQAAINRLLVAKNN